MRKKILWLLALTAILLAWQGIRLSPSYQASPTYAEESMRERARIILVPLDGRPPCRRFPVDAGEIAGLRVDVPPTKLQDYYSERGDAAGMRAWAMESASGADAAILSIDQLLYGGLLAAREGSATDDEIDSLVLFLRELHAAHPGLPVYAFTILPRLAPQDSIDGRVERKNIMSYSRLLGRQAAGLPVDEAELAALVAVIPENSLKKYLAHFEESRRLCERLAELASENVIEKLVIGQDDGEAYGVPNIEAGKLHDFLAARGIPEERAALVHGADEIALALIAEIECRSSGYRPLIHVEYSSEAAANATMPFMAIPMRECVEEKIRMMGARIALRPEEADFTLFVSANSRSTLSGRLSSARRIKELVEQGRPVALVDLSRAFSPEECLLPLLIREQTPINGLIAYAGWNTASNSIGTALSEATICSVRRRETRTRGELLTLCRKNLIFLQNRCLEDYFYLKDVIDHVNAALKREGYTNTADLDLAKNYRFANAIMQHAMKERIASYRETVSFKRPFTFRAPEGSGIPGDRLRLCAKSLSAEMSYPWPRTFEINLQCTLELEECEE